MAFDLILKDQLKGQWCQGCNEDEFVKGRVKMSLMVSPSVRNMKMSYSAEGDITGVKGVLKIHLWRVKMRCNC